MSLSNNDVLRRFRYALNISDVSMSEAFRLAGKPMNQTNIACLLKQETDAEFVECDDLVLGAYLDGLIIQRRGVREGGPVSPPASGRINNNDILKKIRIALELREEDLIAIMKVAGVTVSASEVNALFRQKKHPNFKLCGDQFLRNFLTGLETWRPAKKPV
jgi:uncharacterized protein YehS (DUF1456 family)